MAAHDFCRVLFRQVRIEAKEKGVSIPKGMTALRCGRDQFFLESRSEVVQKYKSGCCAWDAKAKYISELIDRRAA